MPPLGPQVIDRHKLHDTPVEDLRTPGHFQVPTAGLQEEVHDQKVGS